MNSAERFVSHSARRSAFTRGLRLYAHCGLYICDVPQVLGEDLRVLRLNSPQLQSSARLDSLTTSLNPRGGLPSRARNVPQRLPMMVCSHIGEISMSYVLFRVI